MYKKINVVSSIDLSMLGKELNFLTREKENRDFHWREVLSLPPPFQPDRLLGF